MSAISRSNFEDKYPEIVANIKNAAVIGIDNEFTGLLSDLDFKSSLFDTGAERYDKLRQSIENFIVMEIGVTTFELKENENKYLANKYTFYVYPRSFSSIDTKFMCQASSLEFLCQHGFDFNKFVYGGIPYLNKQQESQLRKELYDGLLFRNLERTITMDDERLIQSGCSLVSEWVQSAVLSDTLRLDVDKFCKGEKRLIYILHKELRRRFLNIWTYPDEGHIKVQVISREERKALEDSKQNDRSLEDDMMNSLLGFTHVFKLLMQERKPIVGHNLLLDLMIWYSQFHEPLPTDYNVFKEKIHKMFPVVYDTKYLSFELQKLLKKEVKWDSNILSSLYYYFKNGYGRTLILYSPVIEYEPGSDTRQDPLLGEAQVEEEVQFHEAGWDSFCTGYCFIRLAHIFAHISAASVMEGRTLSSKELLAAVYSRKNCINVIRASISHMRLDGPDPLSTRPGWIHVQARGFRSIDVSKVAELFAKFGAVDVKPFSRSRALVAVGNHRSASDILKEFQKHSDFRVSFYHPIRHSPFLNTFLWSSVFISGVVGVCLLYRHFTGLQTPAIAVKS